MHGGLSPELKSLEQIKRIARPTDVPDSGLLCDLLWADPDKDIQGWGENDRGVSYTFGPDCVTEFLQKHDLDLVCRAHQVRGCMRRTLPMGTGVIQRYDLNLDCRALQLEGGGGQIMGADHGSSAQA